MIEVYIKRDDGSELQKSSDLSETDCWIKVTDPTQGEISSLIEDCNIPLDFFTDSLDIDERSRVEIDEDGILIVFRASIYDETVKPLPFYTLPIGIILKKDKIITVCSKDIEFFDNFIFGRVKNFSTAKKNKFILQMFNSSTRSYLAYLKLINKRIENVEDEFEDNYNSSSIKRLKNIEKNLYSCLSSMRGNAIVNDRLNRHNIIVMFEDDEDLLEDIIIDNNQAIEMASIYMHNIKSLNDYFSAMISNHLNSVMKFLTSVTIVLMFPTLIASIYGMNVSLPMMHNPLAFTMLMGLSVGGSLLIIYLFIKRDWF